MRDSTNPYFHALDGMDIDDPVVAFFDFCKAREQIRLVREQGSPPPWSDDPIFQQGRFLNVFREDDRVSQSIIRFAQPLRNDLPALVQALFFSRWCNAASTLDELSPIQLGNPSELKSTLEAQQEQPWCNMTAYPVEMIQWDGDMHSRIDAASHVFLNARSFIADALIGACGNVIDAVQTINQTFRMNNDFPIFMAVMDVAWFRPDIIHPSSPVPTGIGALPWLDRLQKHLGLDNHQQVADRMMELQKQYWPDAKRQLQPIDIEYLSCECRKYYSYINGTKEFAGKNRFEAGKSARFVFDIDATLVPASEIRTEIHVLAGGPCSGKSTLRNALLDQGFDVIEESAEVVLAEGVEKGSTPEQMRADPQAWQEKLLVRDFELFNELQTSRTVFTDTSIIETIVFAERAGFSIGPNLEAWLNSVRFSSVFFLEPIESYEQTGVRRESQVLAKRLSESVRNTYERYGYSPVVIAPTSVAQRLELVLEQLNKSAAK